MDLNHNEFYHKALAFIAQNDLMSMAPGRYILDGDNLFVNIVDDKLKDEKDARLEVHNRYIDVQVPLSGSESFGVKPRAMAEGPEGEFDTAKDILFFSDKDWQTITVGAGQAITFDPDTAHAPLIGSGAIRKAIFKVKA